MKKKNYWNKKIIWNCTKNVILLHKNEKTMSKLNKLNELNTPIIRKISDSIWNIQDLLKSINEIKLNEENGLNELINSISKSNFELNGLKTYKLGINIINKYENTLHNIIIDIK